MVSVFRRTVGAGVGVAAVAMGAFSSAAARAFDPPPAPPVFPVAAAPIAAVKMSQNASTTETPDHARRMTWFREAKFGLFIHWGLYALPAGEWKGQDVPGIGEWIMNRAQIPVKDYEQLAGQFNPTEFDADKWAKLASDAGMKYLVITSKHHDGFAMFRSQASPYNIFDATPFHRDPLAELAKACQKHHIRLGFYYSQSQDWHEPNGAGNGWDFGPDEAKNYDQYLRSKAEPQVKELLTHYGPVCLIWFDTPRMMSGNRAQRFADIVRTAQPDCLIDGRLGTAGDYQSTGDNSIPNTIMDGDWEVPATLNHTWGFKKNDTDWKTPEDLTFKLVDIVSKGGNYLLNVGPTAQGIIPQQSQTNLRVVGKWLKTNGEAIYGAGITPFGEEFGGPDPTGTLDAKGKPKFLAKTAWRCTTKPDKLYIHVFDYPGGGTGGTFALPATGKNVTKAYLLADKKHAALPLTHEGNGLQIVLPPKTAKGDAAKLPVVICLEVQ